MIWSKQTWIERQGKGIVLKEVNKNCNYSEEHREWEKWEDFECINRRNR
jgi:hypothetical protein